jgi:hypothetical protein
LHGQYEEILKLRELLKKSLSDQREWFELEVSANRLIAVGPATSHSREVTADVIREVQRATGLDGSRLLHFMTPISELRLDENGIPSTTPLNRTTTKNLALLGF